MTLISRLLRKRNSLLVSHTVRAESDVSHTVRAESDVSHTVRAESDYIRTGQPYYDTLADHQHQSQTSFVIAVKFRPTTVRSRPYVSFEGLISVIRNTTYAVAFAPRLSATLCSCGSSLFQKAY